MDFDPTPEVVEPVASVVVPTKTSRRTMWIVGGVVGAVLIVGGAIAAAILLTSPSTPPPAPVIQPTTISPIVIPTRTITPSDPSDPAGPDSTSATIGIAIPQYQFITFGTTLTVRSTAGGDFISGAELDLRAPIRRCVLGPFANTVYALGDKVYIVDVSKQTEMKVIGTIPYKAIDLVVSPDNKWLFLITEDSDQKPTFIRILRLNFTIHGSIIPPVNSFTKAIRRLVLSKDTRYLFCVNANGLVLGQMALTSFSNLTFEAEFDPVAFEPVIKDLAVSSENETLVILTDASTQVGVKNLLFSLQLDVNSGYAAPISLAVSGATAVETSSNGSIAYVGCQLNSKPSMLVVRVSDGTELARSTLSSTVNASVTAIRRVADRLFVYFADSVVDLPINGPYVVSQIQKKPLLGNAGIPSQSFLLKTV